MPIGTLSYWFNNLRGVTIPRLVTARNGSQPLTRAGALLDVKEAAEAAGLSRWRLVSPRAVRFAFASHMIGNGFDKKLLAYMLGDVGSKIIG